MTSNKQPFYHRAVLFTATTAVDRADFMAVLRDAIARVPERKRQTIIPESVEVEEMDDAEPGDPSDLLE